MEQSYKITIITLRPILNAQFRHKSLNRKIINLSENVKKWFFLKSRWQMCETSHNERRDSRKPLQTSSVTWTSVLDTTELISVLTAAPTGGFSSSENRKWAQNSCQSCYSPPLQHEPSLSENTPTLAQLEPLQIWKTVKMWQRKEIRLTIQNDALKKRFLLQIQAKGKKQPATEHTSYNKHKMK